MRSPARSRIAASIVAASMAALMLVVSPGWGQGIQVAPGEQGRLRADRVRYDARDQVFVAEGNVLLTIGRLEIRAVRLRLEQRTQVAHASGGVMVRQGDLGLNAAEATYEIRSRFVRASGGVVLMQKDVTVRAPQATFSLSTQTLAASGGVTILQGRSALSGRTLVADLVARRALVEGEGELVRAAAGPIGPGADSHGTFLSRQTVIRAPRMSLRWEPDEAEASGGVRVLQGDRVVRAERAHYVEAAGQLELLGQVTVEQFGEGPSLTGARLTARRLLINTRDGGMEAHSEVSVTQRGRTAIGERAVYREREQQITVTGRVQMTDEDGNTVRADRVVISLSEDTFEASGNVETVFKVKPGK